MASYGSTGPEVGSDGMDTPTTPLFQQGEQEGRGASRHSDGASWRRPVVAVAVAALAVSGLVYANASIGRPQGGAEEMSDAAMDAASVGGGAMSGASALSALQASASAAGDTKKSKKVASKSSSSDDSSDPLHVLFILADDQGFNDVGYSSNDLAGLTPTLDTMADAGIKLRQYYGQQLCTPARGALMTGKYPIRIGLHHDVIHPDAPWGLPLEEKTLPQYLKENGYKTHMIGKWHLGHFSMEYMPGARGFDSFYGYLTDTVKYFTHAYPDTFQGQSYYDMVRQDSSMKDFPLNFSVVDDINGVYTTNLFNDVADEILKEHDPSEPLFLYMSYQNVHEPYTPAPHDSWMSDYELELLENNTKAGSNRRNFAKSLIMLDHGVKNLTAMFTKYGLAKNTLTIYSSDNGGCPQFGGYNYPLRGMKYYLFEGGIRVHGFVHGPMLPSDVTGSSYEGMMHISDWMPTILSAAGVADLPEGLDGIDHWDALTTVDAQSPRTEFLYNIDPYYSTMVQMTDGSINTMLTRVKPRAALRVGDWKLLLNEYCVSYFNPLEDLGRPEGCGQDSCATPGADVNSTNFLFNLITDPYEENNVIDEYPDIAKKLMLKIDDYMQDMVEPHFRGTDAIAYSVWAKSGFITPWVRTWDLEDESSLNASQIGRGQDYPDEGEADFVEGGVDGGAESMGAPGL